MITYSKESKQTSNQIYVSDLYWSNYAIMLVSYGISIYVYGDLLDFDK